MGISKTMTYDGLNRTGGDDYATRIDFATIGATKAVKHAPVTAIITATTHTVSDTDRYLIVNAASTCTLTLPAAASWPGREIYVKTIANHAVSSASSNVKPAGSNTAGTAIVAQTAGKFALLVSDGTNWVVMASN
jgi:hypothetical protein